MAATREIALREMEVSRAARGGSLPSMQEQMTRSLFAPIDPVTKLPISPPLVPAARHGDWMQTSQGRQFWPLDPRPEEIHIEDIAAGLSRLCRYGGQLRHDVEFYSVAEHSVFVAEAAPPGKKLEALLHDSPESFIQDLIRPIKPAMTGYEPIETRLATVIGRRYGVTLHPLSPEVKRLDNAILADERDQVMAKPPRDWKLTEPALGIKLPCWSPFKARFEFLAAFRRYGGHWC